MNNFAIDNNGIAEILKRSSAAMAAANNTLEQNIALGVAGKLLPEYVVIHIQFIFNCQVKAKALHHNNREIIL